MPIPRDRVAAILEKLGACASIYECLEAAKKDPETDRVLIAYRNRFPETFGPHPFDNNAGLGPNNEVLPSTPRITAPHGWPALADEIAHQLALLDPTPAPPPLPEVPGKV